VSLMVNATPLLSLTIFEDTRLEGVIVGKGPAVSVGLTSQELESVPEADVVSATFSFAQDLSKGATKASPNADTLFFKKIFRSIIFILFMK